MVKLFGRFGRISGRMVRSLWQLRGTWRMILALLGLFGLGIASQNWSAFRAWLLADWSHWGFCALSALFVAAFAAMYGMEKEFDGLRSVKAEAREGMSIAEFFPERELRHDLKRNILFLTVFIAFRNSEPHVLKVKIPSRIQAIVRRGWRRQRVNLEVYGQSAFRIGNYPKIGNFVAELWRELPAKDETVCYLTYWGTFPEPGANFVGKPLTTRFEFKFIGHPDLDVVVGVEAIRDTPPRPAP